MMCLKWPAPFNIIPGHAIGVILYCRLLPKSDVPVRRWLHVSCMQMRIALLAALPHVTLRIVTELWTDRGGYF